MSKIRIEKSAVDPSACVSEAWELVKPNYALFIIMGIIVAFVPTVLGLIPYAGDGLSILSAGPLLCGYYFAFLQAMRREPVAVNSLAEGFGKFLPAVLTTLIVSVPALVYAAIIYLFFVARGTDSSGISIFGGGATPLIVVSALIIYVITLILHALTFFMMPLIADRSITFADAFKLSIEGVANNPGGIIILLILQFLLGLAGALALCIGIFFVIPIIYGSNIIAYKKVFPDDSNGMFEENPPQPDSYGSSFGKFE